MTALNFDPGIVLERIEDLWLEGIKRVTTIQDLGMKTEQDYSVSLDPFKCSLIRVKFKYCY